MKLSLHLGAILGGPEQIDWPFLQTSQAVYALKETKQGSLIDPQDAGLDLVFQYPGKIFQPEFEGMRTGRFSRKARMLQIQVSVPEAMIKSSQFGTYYVDAVKEAIKLAHTVFKKKGLSFSEEAHLALAEELRKAI
jgi:hypothetical protein